MSETPPDSPPQPLAPSRRKKRLRLSFSLRAMLVLVALLAIPLGWLAWQWQIVKERKAIVAELQRASHVNCLWIYAMEADPIYGPAMNATNGQKKIAPYRISWIRRVLGDDSCMMMQVDVPIEPQLLERLEVAFPEAELVVAVPGGRVSRDSLYKPEKERRKNHGTLFKTGKFED